MMEVDSGRACPSLSGRMMEVDSGRACPSLSALDGDAGDEEVSELMGEVDGMNGDAEDCRHVVDKLDKTAIIKQDVMLSARDTQSPMTSAFHVSASSGSSSSASSLNDSGFWGASSPESQDISDCIKTDSISSMFSQSNQNFSSQSVTTSLLTTNQNSPTSNDKPSGRSVLPVQQLLIPVSTSNGTQQLISIPLSLAAGSGSPIQLLSTPGGQLIATNLPGLGQPLNLSLPGSQCLAQASQLLKNNNKNILNSINSNLLLARQQNSDKLATITVKPVNKTKPASHIIAVSKQPLNAATVNGIVALTTSARNKISQESDEADSRNSSISGGSPPLGATNSSKFTTQLLVNLASGATTAHRLSNGSALLNGGTVLKTANGVTVSGSRTVSINGIGENGLNGRGSVGIPVTSLHSHLNGGINSSGLHSLGAATIGGVVPSNINQLLPNTISSAKAGTVVDGVNLDEIREFAKQFKIRRLSLGLTQTQVGQALCTTEGPSYSQSAICRFEKLDITPKSAQKIKPVLEKWMSEAEERYQSGLHNMSDYIGSESSKKRKRRTSFTPQALEVLNEYFERNTHPSGADMTKLAETLSYNREVIRIWFCNKRQALKNTVRRLSMPKDVEC